MSSLDNFVDSGEAKSLQEAQELEWQKNCNHAPSKWKDIFIDSKLNTVVRTCECGYIVHTTKDILDQVIVARKSTKQILNFLTTFQNDQSDNQKKASSTKPPS